MSILSHPVSATTPEGANSPVASTRRRGLSYLRGLSQGRPSGTTASAITNVAESSRTSPRSYFQRSTSYTEPKNQRPAVHRRRSASRPDEPTTSSPEQSSHSGAIPTDQARSSPREVSPSAETRRPRSVARQAESGQSGDNTEDTMGRHRPSSSRNATSGGETSTAEQPLPSGRSQPRRTTSTNLSTVTSSESADGKPQLPTIRLFPHQEIRNGRQSLNFPPISRTLPGEGSIIRVGRYSEREGVPASNPTAPSDAPVGFKSKVVSRRHCEFTFSDGHWLIRDVASSSGTFLNHIRLSQPNQESKLFPIKDGDIVQLGIDFRGGEEMIFRCVKIRIECNRSWQKRPNNFNKIRHAQLQSLAKDQPSADAKSGECSICLGSVLPCQSLFVAPCAHVWHYKCIRPMLEGKNSTYPQFQCPNCRAYTDLTAEVDIAESDMDEWMENAADDESPGASADVDRDATNVVESPEENAGEDLAVSVISTSPEESSPGSGLGGSGLLARRQAANPASPEVQSVNGIGLPGRAHDEPSNDGLDHQHTRIESPGPEQTILGEGPLTPRNDAGPFVFDGSAGRAGGRRIVVSAIPEVTENGLD